MTFKSGFVNIVGNPNVGKSTLMNELVGERLSIITHKSQTTRHRILGIVNADDYQIVFSDTPGILKPNYKLQESMLRFSESALIDADVLLYITDVYESPEKNSEFLQKVMQLTVPILLVINKIDLSSQDELTTIVEAWEKRMPNVEIIPCSALTKFNVAYILKRISALLPEGEPYYDTDTLTDKPTRFFVSEIIREKILMLYKKEIPYSVEVLVEDFIEEAKHIHIRAVVFVARESQKGIIIGNKGAGIKRLGTTARKDIEAFVQKNVYLELLVKVKKDWRDNDTLLSQFGYKSGD
ncbi:MAG: GTPase Era [Bacteroidales bacterium]|jgi:GTP-binding protein Era|nr:GTPase Era [Bacteroidales bacterium]NLK82196.1 GTPase Era [Bacteroidales bacterium]